MVRIVGFRELSLGDIRRGKVGLLFPANGFVNFLPMDRDFFRRINAQADFIPSDFNHHDSDLIADDNSFVLFATEY